MFDLEAIEQRHAAGSPAKEDIGDLIAEVKRLSAGKPAAETDKIVGKPVDKFTGKPIDTTEYE